MPSIFTRKNYLELWKDGEYISRHTSRVECADAAFAQGEGLYEIRIPSGLYYEINVPRSDITIYNVSADEPAGIDLTVNAVGAKAVGSVSAVSASEQSNSVTVYPVGANVTTSGGTAVPPSEDPDPNQDTYFSGIDTVADIDWRTYDDIVTGYDWSFPPEHIAKYGGVFQNPGYEGLPNYFTGPRLTRLNVRWKDLEPLEGDYSGIKKYLMDPLDALASSVFVGAHVNVRGNALYVVNAQGNRRSAQETAPQWLINKVSPGYDFTRANNTNIIRETSNGIIDNFDLRVDAVTDGWLKLIDEIEAAGFFSHPMVHNQLGHAVSYSQGEEATGTQWDSTSGVREQYLPVIQAWVAAYKRAGTEKRFMWLKQEDATYNAATIGQGTGVRGGGAIEKWLSDKYSPGNDEEHGGVAELYQSGHLGSFYMTVDNDFIITKEDRAWQEQNERGYSTSNAEDSFHYRMSNLRCAQFGFDNVFVPNSPDAFDPRATHWLSYQLGQNAGDQSAEAFCYLGEFWTRGGDQFTPFGDYRLRNIEKWCYQREYHGATTRTNKQNYVQLITARLIGKEGGEEAGWFSRRGSDIQFSLDPEFITGLQPVAIKVTYEDNGTSAFTLNYNNNTKSRSITKSNSGEVRTVTWFLYDFVGDSSTVTDPTMSLTGDGATDFFMLKVTKV